MFPVLQVSEFRLKNNKTVEVLNPVQAYFFFLDFFQEKGKRNQ